MTGGRIVAFGVLLSVCPTVRLPAQVSFHVGLGARYSSILVHDSIVAPFDVRPAIGPALAVTAIEHTRGPWMPDATLDVSWSGLQRHDAGGGSARITSLTTLAVTVGVRREVQVGLALRAGVGALKYLPGDATGLFRDGSGIAALGSVAVDWAPPPASRHGLGLTLRYDAHRFLTPALRSEGFTTPQLVHRVSVGIRARVTGTP